ncbi:ATPase, AAA family protein [Tritrichomonas foetus]|uniref:ATPase, AAA family protein n=1 Tax=Tritrichomonas foetus TaxID=1144522 RepID=A0A1J4JJF6_9EUKA|nr:ATPase, AAA family protein [Tritrichomonas foetus]|eukprot:OHS97380.1 ATPase, AAA family protein [Tritrichomonas foetus]
MRHFFTTLSVINDQISFENLFRILNFITVSAPNLPPFCVQVSSSCQNTSQQTNIAILKSSKYSPCIFFCVFVNDVEANEVYINPEVIQPNENVTIEFVKLDINQKIESIAINPRFRFPLIGLPILPGMTTFYSYHGRIYNFTNSSELSGFISDKTKFLVKEKKDLDEITELMIEKNISDRIIKMIRYRSSIITKTILVVGNCGSGKSYFVKNTIKNVKNCHSLNLLRFISELEVSKFDYIETITSLTDGVLLIDDVCTLTPQIASILVEKLSVLDDKPVIIIGTSRNPPYSLPIPLQALFPYALNISSLRHAERRTILEKHIPSDYLDFVIRETSGSTRGELNNLIKILPSLNPFTQKSFTQLLKSISTSEKPMQLRASDTKPKVAGYHREINEIKLFLRVSFSDDSSLLQYSGIMLTGKSGNGKSLIIRALSEEFEVPFFVLEFDKVFSRYLGESEKAIREVFAAARFFSPCAVIIEDIDAIGAKRSDESGVGGRVLSTLLNEIDGINKKSKVLLIATTNAPQIVDSALMRPGRFDRIIEIGMPSEQDRIEIFELLREKTPVSDDVTNKWLAELTDGYTCAEIQSFFRFSALQALRDEKESVSKDYFLLGQKRVQERKSSFENMNNKL